MLRKLCLIAILSCMFEACQPAKEYDDLLNDLEGNEVFLTDQEACVEYFIYFAPIAAKCEGFVADSALEAQAIAECTAMKCNNIDKNWEESLVDDCIKYYAVCGDPIGDPPWYSCEHSVMATCIDVTTDTATE